VTSPQGAANPPGTVPGGPRRLFLDDVARLAGVAYSTARRYHTHAETARKNTAAGLPVPGPWRTGGLLPPPVDYQHGQGRPRPYWDAETLQPWLDGRQGPGRNRRDGSPPQPRIVPGRRRKPGPKAKPKRRRTPA